MLILRNECTWSLEGIQFHCFWCGTNICPSVVLTTSFFFRIQTKGELMKHCAARNKVQTYELNMSHIMNCAVGEKWWQTANDCFKHEPSKWVNVMSVPKIVESEMIKGWISFGILNVLDSDLELCLKNASISSFFWSSSNFERKWIRDAMATTMQRLHCNNLLEHTCSSQSFESKNRQIIMDNNHVLESRMFSAFFYLQAR